MLASDITYTTLACILPYGAHQSRVASIPAALSRIVAGWLHDPKAEFIAMLPYWALPMGKSSIVTALV
jgi:hypothetical protein